MVYIGGRNLSVLYISGQIIVVMSDTIIHQDKLKITKYLKFVKL